MTPEVSIPNIREIERLILSSDRSTWRERENNSFRVERAWTRKEIVTGAATSSPIFVAESKWCPLSGVCSPFISRMPDTFHTYWIVLGESGKKVSCSAKEFSAVEQRWNAYKQEIVTELQLVLADVAQNPINYRWKAEKGCFVTETNSVRLVLSCETKPGRFSRPAYCLKAISKENDSIDVSVSGRSVKPLFVELSRVA